MHLIPVDIGQFLWFAETTSACQTLKILVQHHVTDSWKASHCHAKHAFPTFFQACMLFILIAATLVINKGLYLT